jgi:hypothetical protein
VVHDLTVERDEAAQGGPGRSAVGVQHAPAHRDGGPELELTPRRRLLLGGDAGRERSDPADVGRTMAKFGFGASSSEKNFNRSARLPSTLTPRVRGRTWLVCADTKRTFF